MKDSTSQVNVVFHASEIIKDACKSSVNVNVRDDDTITFKQVVQLSKECKKSVDELLKGTRVVRFDMPCTQKREQDPKFKSYLEYLRKKEISKEIYGHSSNIGIAGIGKEISDTLSVGVNIIAAMATGFVVFWYLGRNAFGGANEVNGLICGAVGMIGALLVETWIFMLRDERKHITDRKEANKVKNKALGGKDDKSIAETTTEKQKTE
jgi:hypothetical protein